MVKPGNSAAKFPHFGLAFQETKHEEQCFLVIYSQGIIRMILMKRNGSLPHSISLNQRTDIVVLLCLL